MDLPTDVHISPGSGMNSKSSEPPIIPVSGEKRYLTPLWVSDNEEPREELHQYHSFQWENMEKARNNLCLETPVRPLFGDSRYLTTLWVSKNEDSRVEEQQVFPIADSSLSTISSFDRKAKNDQLKLQDKIKSALKRLTFREQRVLVQFWSPRVTDKHLLLLTTIDQPFGLGVIDDQGLVSFRKYSECNPFLVDKDHQEEDCSPPARVFRRGLPEWASDILTNYSPKHFPLQDCAISCNLHGYLALPVFDSTTRLCVGVLELLMSSKNTSFAYEVQQLHLELKKEKLTSPRTFSFPFPIASEAWKNYSDINYKIFKALQIVCSTHSLPFAQTWAASPSTSLVSHDQVIGKSCNSFHARCIGKLCLSTADLPYHWQHPGMRSFRKANREQHLESPRGVVGRVFSTHAPCYCVDVTKLGEQEYPLVYYARMSKLTGCFAIFLQSDDSNHQYVLEFFLPEHIKDIRYLSSMMGTLKENMEVSGFELGDKSSIQVVGPHIDLYIHEEPDIIQTSSNEIGDSFSCIDSSCSEQSVTSIAGNDSANVVSPTQICKENTCTKFTDDVEKSKLKEDRKRKRYSDIPVTREVTVKATFDEIKEEFQFCFPSELSNLKNEVAKRFNLKGNTISLKYYDEDNDLILICVSEDVEFALSASGSNDTISLIVKINCEDQGGSL
uniref:protein NLP7-like isoform X2 n=1 Tax=Erigeron canadensis TaxID=72917 RepID=UPI001CB8E6F5|nr:protein NLP7-like isoform X2 [Erigeron canadensis]XP_043608638.1 protein NLP7-like isoform X2 [Erigeron canadensis]XP_043608639.1 protein NLP7-like isoform X2 [Erigeron canadensis]